MKKLILAIILSGLVPACTVYSAAVGETDSGEGVFIFNAVSSSDLATKLSLTNVVQTTGTSTTAVMSQNAVTTNLNSYLPNSSTNDAGFSLAVTVRSVTSATSARLKAVSTDINNSIELSSGIPASDSSAYTLGANVKTNTFDGGTSNALFVFKRDLVIRDEGGYNGTNSTHTIVTAEGAGTNGPASFKLSSRVGAFSTMITQNGQEFSIKPSAGVTNVTFGTNGAALPFVFNGSVQTASFILPATATGTNYIYTFRVNATNGTLEAIVTTP